MVLLAILGTLIHIVTLLGARVGVTISAEVSWTPSRGAELPIGERKALR